MSITRSVSFLTILTTLVGYLTAAPALAVDLAPSNVLRVLLQADQIEYSIATPINVRITITNKSGLHYAYFARPVSVLAKLQVISPSGQLVSPHSEIAGALYQVATNDVRELAPGQSITLASFGSNASSEWIDLRSWGYQLKEPGRYTITATTNIYAFQRAKDGSIIRSTFTTMLKDTSNAIRIRILR